MEFMAYVTESKDSVKISLGTLSKSGAAIDHTTHIERVAGRSTEDAVAIAVDEYLELVDLKRTGYGSVRIVEANDSRAVAPQPLSRKLVALAIIVIAFVIGACAGGYYAGNGAKDASGSESNIRALSPMSFEKKIKWLQHAGFSSPERRVELFSWAEDNGILEGAGKAAFFLESFSKTNSPSVKAAKSYLRSLDVEQAAGAARQNASSFGRSPDEMEALVRRVIGGIRGN